MSLRDLLRRRQGLAAPPVPCPPADQGTEKSPENQQGSLCSLGSLANARERIRQEVELDDVYRAFGGIHRDTACHEGIPPQTLMVEQLGPVGHHKKQVGQGEAGSAHEVETLLAALADAGRDLGPALAHRLRETLLPLSRQVRAELIAVIDDAFEVAPDVEAACRHAHRLLDDPAAVEAAKAVWPAYPDPP
ncbi:hypothetical protein RSO68_14715 [Halomonas saccharevitans]|uniref:Uncharacterized protein n=1 Tax=Halomonas saccharevitans TaxID=416872 RepID=A0ABU3NHT3_9GAMM|nr:hypothetical protein [Halomonas saccharevitans]MDT8880726.1 hypothetical protein [Halomonas saccharevitans]